MVKPSLAQTFAFFRLSLATGLIQPAKVIAWADREILGMEDAPPHELIELSLSGSQPLSQIVGRLYDWQSYPGDPVPLEMLLARAGILLDNGAPCADLARELCLLLAENKLPGDLKRELKQLEAGREKYNREELSDPELGELLAAFLVPYQAARAWLPVLE